MSRAGLDKSAWLCLLSVRQWLDFFFSKLETISLSQLLCLSVWQDEAVVMGTVWRDGHGSARLPDDGSVCREPVHQGTAGTQRKHSSWLFMTPGCQLACSFPSSRWFVRPVASCSNPRRTLTHKKGTKIEYKWCFLPMIRQDYPRHTARISHWMGNSPKSFHFDLIAAICCCRLWWHRTQCWCNWSLLQRFPWKKRKTYYASKLLPGSPVSNTHRDHTLPKWLMTWVDPQ